MQAYGTDRIRAGDGDQFIVFSRLSKGWKARVPKTLTSAEFPGTAVLWENAYFQVVGELGLPQGGVQYVLEPWPEHHAMRTTDRYDEETEAARVAEWRAQIAREKHRKSANVLAVFTGQLPAVVQQELGRELGLLPHRLTMTSVVFVYLVVGALLLWFVSGIINLTPHPFIIVLIAGYLALETTIRFHLAWSQGRPMGSAAGVICYVLYYALRGRRTGAISPFGVEKGWDVPITPAPADVALQDAFVLREPLVTLLSVEDQRRVAARFDYDYRRSARTVAILLLVFSLLGIGTSIHMGATVSLICAVALSCEQLYRLTVLRRRPAGSVIGFVVRPLMRKLIA